MKSLFLSVLLISLLASITTFGQEPTPPPPPSRGAQDEDEVVRITTNLVQVDAVVTDKSGRQVTDLDAADFEILEDDRAQNITNFSYVTVAPPATDRPPTSRATSAEKNVPPVPAMRLRPEQVRRTIALVVDDLGLSFESTAFVRQALRKYVEEQMRPGDLVAIIRTSAGTGALQQFTSDKRQLNAAIERVRWYPMGRGRVGSFAPIDLDPQQRLKIRAQETLPAGTIGNLDYVGADEDINNFRNDVFSIGTLGAVRFVVQGLSELPGRKSLLLISDGLSIFNTARRTESGKQGEGDRGLRDQDNSVVLDSLRRLTDIANRSSVVIYAMDARGLQTLGITASDRSDDMTPRQIEERLTARRNEYFDTQDGLNYLARQTGGYLIHDTNDLAGGIQKVVNDQTGYYLIGYRPDDSTFDQATGRRKFHHLILKVKRPGLKVRTRTGFYGITDENVRSMPRTGEQQLSTALMSPFSAGDVHLRLTSLFGYDPPKGSLMRALMHIDGRDLSFTDESDGWHKVSFDVLAVTFGDSGEMVDKYGRTETMRVREEAYRAAQQNGIVYTLNVPIKKAGAYQLRVAVRDASSNRVGSASQFIEVPDLSKGRLALSGIVINGHPSKIAPGAVSSPVPPNQSAAPGEASGKSESASDPMASPAVRQLHPGMALQYAYLIYNAKLEGKTGRPKVETQLRLFRDGQPVYTGNARFFESGQQADLKRLAAAGTLQLSPEAKEGDYILQITVQDLLADKKHQTVTAWIDFQVIK